MIDGVLVVSGIGKPAAPPVAPICDEAPDGAAPDGENISMSWALAGKDIAKNARPTANSRFRMEIRRQLFSFAC
jgi:hypothetical protein